MQCLTSFYNCICCEWTAHYPDPYSFEVDANAALPVDHEDFQTNQIKTTKYNILNFVPKAILTQFRRVANVYFLFVAILATIPGTVEFQPILIWMPLLFVMLFAIFKEAFEDYQRLKLDRETNNIYSTDVMRSWEIQQVPWREVRVGEICRVKEDQTFPADLLLLTSSSEEGVAYIQTSSLDGEQTSKTRYAFPQINDGFKGQEGMRRLTAKVEVTCPCQSLEEFRGSISLNGSTYSFTNSQQLLFRGAKLKNTEWIWGVAVYTGPCSKIMLNARSFKTKLSSVERKLNYLLGFLFFVQLTFCLVFSGVALEREDAQRAIPAEYLIWPNNSDALQYFLNFFGFIVEFSTTIPIALIVSIQIVKLAQSYFIDFDKLMYNQEKKRGVLAKVAAINEELGQIEYVFTDKTGTLTKNKMVFNTALIGDHSYLSTNPNSQKEYFCQELLTELQDNSSNSEALSQPLILDPNDSKSIRITTLAELRQFYMTCLLVCNNVTTVKRGAQAQLKYQGESPDELALVYFAKSMHYQMLVREKNNITAQIKGDKVGIKVIERFAFTSERKRMSVMIEWKGRILLFTKGADNVITQRINKTQFKVQQGIDTMSREGLRTLMVAVREIPRSEYQQFKKEYEVTDYKKKDEMVNSYAQKFEKNLTLLGATGLLDELQDKVPQTLEDLQRAKINVWMLTGDKLETAIEVSKACRLIQPYHELMQFTGTQDCNTFLDRCEQRINESEKKLSLVIEGHKFAEIINDDACAERFAQLSVNLCTVICCRMLPIQKSQTVSLISQRLGKICLSIGDGGNDVSMIKEAQVGVGLYGEEGMNAVQASDYAIPEFRMLWRLLFVHGRWNYMRISDMILYFMYKSIIFTVPRIAYTFYSDYSGQRVFEGAYIGMYNTLFTALPLLLRALFEQDVNYIYRKTTANDSAQVHPAQPTLPEPQEKYLPTGYTANPFIKSLFPKIYFVGQENRIFNFKNIFIWLLEAVVLGIFATIICMEVVGGQDSLNANGYSGGYAIFSVNLYSAVLMMVSLKLCIHVRHWTWLLFISMGVLSLATYVGFMWFSHNTFTLLLIGSITTYFTTAKTWFVVLLMSCWVLAIGGLQVWIDANEGLLGSITMIMKRDNLDSKSLQDEYKTDRVRQQESHSSESPIVASADSKGPEQT